MPHIRDKKPKVSDYTNKKPIDLDKVYDTEPFDLDEEIAEFLKKNPMLKDYVTPKKIRDAENDSPGLFKFLKRALGAFVRDIDRLTRDVPKTPLRYRKGNPLIDLDEVYDTRKAKKKFMHPTLK